MVKRLSTMRETRVRSLGREDSLEKEMATHSSTLAWKIPWTEEPGTGRGPYKFARRQGRQRGVGTGRGGAGGTAPGTGSSVHGVAKSQTRLSDFTSLPYKSHITSAPSPSEEGVHVQPHFKGPEVRWLPQGASCMPGAAFDSLSDVQTSWFSILSLENCFIYCCCFVFQSCPTLCNPHGLYVGHQAPLSVEFSRQGYGSGLPFPNNVAPSARLETSRGQGCGMNTSQQPQCLAPAGPVVASQSTFHEQRKHRPARS